MSVRNVPAPPPRHKDKGGAGSGFSHAKAAKSTVDDQQAFFEPSVDPEFPQNLLDQTPETTIGMNVSVKGSLEFQNVLRINGKFEGVLISEGDLIIGETGKVIGDINKMGALLIDGKLVGNVNVQRVCLRGNAQVFGDITCRSLQIDPTVVVVGTLNVHSGAPQRIDSEGNEVKDEPKPAKKVGESADSKMGAKGLVAASSTAVPKKSNQGEAESMQAKSEAEAMKAKSEAEAMKAKSEAEAMKAKSEAEAMKAKSEAEAMKAKSEAEAMKAKSEAEAMKAKSEAEAMKAKSEAEKRSRAAQKKKEEEEIAAAAAREEEERAAAEDISAEVKTTEESNGHTEDDGGVGEGEADMPTGKERDDTEMDDPA